MDGRNCSSITGFIYLGIIDNTEDKVTIFNMVLIVYLTGHLANLGMMFLINMDLQLHTPVYFFLGHLSFCVNPMNCIPLGSSVQRISQAKILEWAAISFFRGSSQPRNRTNVSCASCIAGGFLTC